MPRSKQVQQSFTVKKGQTVWGLTSKAIEAKLGRKPTNAEINTVMRNHTKTASGDINKIKPGEKVTINLRGIGTGTASGRTAPSARGSSTSPGSRARKANPSSTSPGSRARQSQPRAKKATAKKTTAKKTGVRHTDRRNSMLAPFRKKSSTTRKRTAPTRSTGRTGRRMDQY